MSTDWIKSFYVFFFQNEYDYFEKHISFFMVIFDHPVVLFRSLNLSLLMWRFIGISWSPEMYNERKTNKIHVDIFIVCFYVIIVNVV